MFCYLQATKEQTKNKHQNNKNPPRKSTSRAVKKFLKWRLKNPSIPIAIQPKQRIKKTNPNKYLPKSQPVLKDHLLGDKNATDEKTISAPKIKKSR